MSRIGRLNFTPEEDAILRRDFARLPAEVLAARLGRTVGSVQGRAYKLRLSGGGQPRKLKPEEAAKAVEMLRTGMTLRQVAPHFKRNKDDFGRQLRAVGVNPVAIRAELRAAKEAKAKAAKVAAGLGSVTPAARKKHGQSRVNYTGAMADSSLAGRAADHLRRDFTPVYHRGRENKAEDGIWQVGSRRMAEADMIALARDKGLDKPSKPAPALVIRSSILEAQAKGHVLPPAGYDHFREYLPRVRTMFEGRAS